MVPISLCFSVGSSSINSRSSIKPLQISKDALRTLKDTYNIGNEIWDLTSTFGDKPLTAAVGEGGIKIKSGENGIQGEYSPEFIHVPKGLRKYFRYLLQTHIPNTSAEGSSQLDYASNGCFPPP